MDFLTRLRELPRRYLLADGGFDTVRAAEDLGIISDERWGSFLLQLYRLDAGVRAQVDACIARIVVESLALGGSPPLEVPSKDDWCWQRADAFCEGCPGSERVEDPPGLVGPLCGNALRADRWSCPKYREQLRAAEAVITEADRQAAARAAQLRVEGRIEEYERAMDQLIASAARGS